MEAIIIRQTELLKNCCRNHRRSLQAFFKCNGAEINLLFMNQGVLFSPGKPDESDINRAISCSRLICEQNNQAIDNRSILKDNPRIIKKI